jgi:CrcB protein
MMMFRDPLLLIAVAFAGGFGSVLRFWLAPLQGWLPWGTLLANTAASALAAFILVQFGSTSIVEVALVSGFAGGLSTLSAYAQQTYEFLRTKLWLQAGAYTLASFLIPSTAIAAIAMFA